MNTDETASALAITALWERDIVSRDGEPSSSAFVPPIALRPGRTALRSISPSRWIVPAPCAAG